MCGLAHYFEDQGLATVVVALVREHAERMRPPRALWVPFELGRPFGAPNAPSLQSRVLGAALALLDRSADAPVLEDFQEPAPNPAGDPQWQAPDLSSATDLASEVALLIPGWERVEQARNGTTYGISGLSPGDAVEYVARYFSDRPMENPRGMARVSRARFAVDDIKCFYQEAAFANGGHPSSTQLNDWLWNDTRAGTMIRDFQAACAASEDNNLKLIAGSLVPAERTNAWR